MPFNKQVECERDTHSARTCGNFWVPCFSPDDSRVVRCGHPVWTYRRRRRPFVEIHICHRRSLCALDVLHQPSRLQNVQLHARGDRDHMGVASRPARHRRYRVLPVFKRMLQRPARHAPC